MIERASLFIHLLRAGFRRECAGGARLMSRASFLCILLTVFTFVWRAMEASGMQGELRPELYVWYLFIAELGVLTIPSVYRDLQEEIRSGDIGTRIIRPIWYPTFALSDAWGGALAAMCVLVPTGITFLILIHGTTVVSHEGLIAALVCAPLAAAIGGCINVLLGLLALWLVDVSAIQWIVSKFLFVLGGLMVPLSLYPEWATKVAQWTPFYWSVYGNARQVFGFSWGIFLSEIAMLTVWLFALLVVVAVVNRRILRALQVGGG